MEHRGFQTRPHAWRAAARTELSTAAAVGAAILLGLACGSAMAPSRSSLPPAGTPHDDGSGVLARASSSSTLPGLIHDPGQSSAGHGGTTYGGATYGGATYGGTLYGNYRFDWGAYQRKPLPHPSHATGYRAIQVRQGGSIEGRVLWPRPPRPASRLATPDPACGHITNDTLRVDRRGQVHGAVVYLADIRSGRHGVMTPSLYPQKLQLGGSLSLRRCRFLPHVQVLSPIGASLRLLNRDRPARTWTGTSAANNQPIFEISMPWAVPRTLALAADGFVHIRDDHTPSSAWVVVARHPYYTVTDRDGSFRLDDIPPGTYTLAVWHEPVAQPSTGANIVYTEPTLRKVRVTVRRKTTSKVLIKLPAVP